jgi:hypothetical protein
VGDTARIEVRHLLDHLKQEGVAGPGDVLEGRPVLADARQARKQPLHNRKLAPGDVQRLGY